MPSTFDAGRYESHDEWRKAVSASDVRLQWDPDHDPFGAPQARRAIQLGLRGKALESYAGPAILQVADITPLVHEQGELVRNQRIGDLLIPVDQVYPIDPDLTLRLGG